MIQLDKVLFWVMICAFRLCLPMDWSKDFDLIHSENAREKIKNFPIQLSLKDQIVYISDHNVRMHLKRVYGETFADNTIFLSVHWRLLLRFTGLEKNDYEYIPAYIPYDYIKDAQENDMLTLTLGSQMYEVICKQHRTKNFKSHLSFDQLLKAHVTSFIARANYLCDDEKSLIQQKIIDVDADDRHGVNRSLYVDQLKTTLSS